MLPCSCRCGRVAVRVCPCQGCGRGGGGQQGPGQHQQVRRCAGAGARGWRQQCPRSCWLCGCHCTHGLLVGLNASMHQDKECISCSATLVDMCTVCNCPFPFDNSAASTCGLAVSCVSCVLLAKVAIRTHTPTNITAHPLWCPPPHAHPAGPSCPWWGWAA
jgi:hypothetical protein